MEWLNIKSKSTYYKIFNDLIEWKFINIIQKAKNQNSANIISISSPFADTKNKSALDSANIQQTNSTRTTDVLAKEHNRTSKQLNKWTKEKTENSPPTPTPPKSKYPKEYNLVWKRFPHPRRSDKGKAYKNYKVLDLTFKEIREEVEILNLEVELWTVEHKFTPAFERWIKDLTVSNQASRIYRCEKIINALYQLKIWKQRSRIFAISKQIFGVDMVKVFEKKNNKPLIFKFT